MKKILAALCAAIVSVLPLAAHSAARTFFMLIPVFRHR